MQKLLGKERSGLGRKGGFAFAEEEKLSQKSVRLPSHPHPEPWQLVTLSLSLKASGRVALGKEEWEARTGLSSGAGGSNQGHHLLRDTRVLLAGMKG